MDKRKKTGGEEKKRFFSRSKKGQEKKIRKDSQEEPSFAGRVLRKMSHVLLWPFKAVTGSDETASTERSRSENRETFARSSSSLFLPSKWESEHDPESEARRHSSDSELTEIPGFSLAEQDETREHQLSDDLDELWRETEEYYQKGESRRQKHSKYPSRIIAEGVGTPFIELSPPTSRQGSPPKGSPTKSKTKPSSLLDPSIYSFSPSHSDDDEVFLPGPSTAPQGILKQHRESCHATCERHAKEGVPNIQRLVQRRQRSSTRGRRRPRPISRSGYSSRSRSWQSSRFESGHCSRSGSGQSSRSGSETSLVERDTDLSKRAGILAKKIAGARR